MKIISFEGIEGVGKSTQINMLYDLLVKKKFKVLIFREPGSTDTGEKIRNILLNLDDSISVFSELFLMFASRAQLIEEKIKNHPRTKLILKKFKKARILEIDKYAEIFNKRNQNFRIQKANPNLILAHKNDGFVLRTPEGFGIGSSKNFYFSHMYNCIYDCRYCFLQGMFSSANYVIFVNFEDFDASIKNVINQNINSKITFFSGYDCDSLALENVTGFAKHILPIFQQYPEVEIEFRTKSIQREPFMSIEPMENVIMAYSLIPDLMSSSLDNKVPSISKRIQVISDLALRGWRIGLRFDPLIHGKDWKFLYEDLLEKVYNSIPLG